MVLFELQYKYKKEEFTASITDERPFCEHCGELEKFSISVEDGGTSYCLDCMASQGLPDKVSKELRKIESSISEQRVIFEQEMASYIKSAFN